ncbi:leucyl/phenylalanyl-tRNA--protein transferase [soil metagenome]
MKPRTTVTWLRDDDPFPPASLALTPDSGMGGLLAASDDISDARLEAAYRHGVFPWYSHGQPVLWWSPDPRMVLRLDRFHAGHSLRKKVRQLARDPRWSFGFDGDFGAVIAACASSDRPGQDGTWITDEVIDAYRRLHVRGLAHSFELRHDGALIGGGYGVAIGRMFYGESMFTRQTDASKVALSTLAAFLQHHGFDMIDCQQNTRHLASFGAREESRAHFLADVDARLALAGLDHWPSHWPLALPDEAGGQAPSTARRRVVTPSSRA